MKDTFNSTLNDCKPWETGVLTNNTNLFNNLKQNLCVYEQGYRKHTIRSKFELPQIHNGNKAKTINPDNKIKDLQSLSTANRSVEISGKPLKKLNSILIKRNENNNQDQQSYTQRRANRQRARNKENLQTKVFLINFQEQNKYGRLKKRELHQVIFGNRSKRNIIQ